MKKKQLYLFAAFSLISILLILALFNINKTQPITHTASDPLVTVDSTQDLFNLFSRGENTLSIDGIDRAPKILLASMPADFKSIRNIQKKKMLFIHVMWPIIIEELQYTRQKRELAKLALENSSKPNQTDTISWFDQAIKEYKINTKLSFSDKKKALLLRIDELPLPLILAQAAIESGWGTSRFAIEGNSLFGEWTYNNKNGITPKDRNEGDSHQVKAFPTLQASVRSYIRNINRNNAYKELRSERAKMRQNNEALDSNKLAEGLHRYSQKGTQYVEIVQSILNSPDFKALQALTLTNRN